MSMTAEEKGLYDFRLANKSYGGAGDYGYYVDPETSKPIGLNEDAYKSLLGTNSGVEMGLSNGSSFNWTNSLTSKDGLGGLALGAGGLALGIADYFAKKPLLEQNLKSAKQAYAFNDEKMDSWRKGQANVKSAFGSGLAASGVTV